MHAEARARARVCVCFRLAEVVLLRVAQGLRHVFPLLQGGFDPQRA